MACRRLQALRAGAGSGQASGWQNWIQLQMPFRWVCLLIIISSFILILLSRKLKCRSVVRSRNTTATSNLIDHARRCTGYKQKKKALKFSRDLLRLKVAQWCAKRGRPFAMVDDEEFGKSYFTVSVAEASLTYFRSRDCTDATRRHPCTIRQISFARHQSTQEGDG